MSKRDDMTELARQLEDAGVPIQGWFWIEQGGAFITTTRPPADGDGEWAEPLVKATDVARYVFDLRGGA